MDLSTPTTKNSKKVTPINKKDGAFEMVDDWHILAVLGKSRDQTLLCRLAEQFNWQVENANSRDEALQVLHVRCTPIVVFDMGLLDVNWKSDLREIVCSPSRPATILVSAAISDADWEEVIRYGGYDVLAFPLAEVKTEMTIRCALRYWANCLSPGSL